MLDEEDDVRVEEEGAIDEEDVDIDVEDEVEEEEVELVVELLVLLPASVIAPAAATTMMTITTTAITILETAFVRPNNRTLDQAGDNQRLFKDMLRF